MKSLHSALIIYFSTAWTFLYLKCADFDTTENRPIAHNNEVIRHETSLMNRAGVKSNGCKEICPNVKSIGF